MRWDGTLRYHGDAIHVRRVMLVKAVPVNGGTLGILHPVVDSHSDSVALTHLTWSIQREKTGERLNAVQCADFMRDRETVAPEQDTSEQLAVLECSDLRLKLATSENFTGS